MQLSRAGEYAIRAMLHLAATSDEGISQIATISKTWAIPESFLRKILQSLTKAGLVASSRGMGGGLTLARPADQITLLDVIEAIEGKIFLNVCLTGPGNCESSTWCPVHCVWHEAQRSFTDILKSKSLKDLVINSDFKEHFQIT
ncbi:Rrf2 family transcriptional regulator [candidate division KSB1 bacterium]|nr:Rrf2 family transcriptional regulator [candidate division KSB1 bacterium]